MRCRRLVSATVVMACLAAAGCAVTNRSASDRAALLQVSEDWVDAFIERDLDALLALYTEDAWIMSAGQPKRVGHGEIRALLAEFLAGEPPFIGLEIEEVGAEGSLGWASVIARIEISDAPEPYFSRTFILYRRGADGRWRIFRDMDNPTPDAKHITNPNEH